MEQAPVLYSDAISIRGRDAKASCEDRGRRQPRKSRESTVEVRAARMTLRPPYRPDGKLPEVTVNVVWVREVNPPEDDEPVEWMLITTLPIDTIGQVREVVAHHRVRWMIEILFRTLKSGCRIEERRFGRLDRLETCLAVFLIVARRTLFVCRLARSSDDLDREIVFEPSEWKSAWTAVRRKPPPEKSPSLNEIVRLVAQPGGCVNRPGREDPPGPQTAWLGLQRMKDLAWAWETFGPGTQ